MSIESTKNEQRDSVAIHDLFSVVRITMKFTSITQIREILEGTVECPNMPYPTFVSRRQDDTDGSTDPEQSITVGMGPDGDMYVRQGGIGQPLLRFRTFHGGTMSEATHNALRFLAVAIQMDNERCPQSFPLNSVLSSPESAHNQQ